MRCFNHPEREAVGICKECQKGLCPECLTDLDDAIACKNKHEEKVKAIQIAADISIRSYMKSPLRRIYPTFVIFMSLFILYYSFFYGAGFSDPALIIGLSSALYGVIMYYRGKEIFKSAKH